MRAILYARVSRGTLQERSRSLVNQLSSCRETAMKNGWYIVAELAENDSESPGRSFNLTKLEEMLDLAALRKFDVWVVTELDRLSRRMAKQIFIEQELGRYGIDIMYVSRHYAETYEDQLDKHIRATIAEYEQAKLAERLIRGQRSAIRAGNVRVSGRAPYGYFEKKEDGLRKLSILEDEADIVRLIFKWYTRGDSDSTLLSTPKIAQRLNQLRIPTSGYNRGIHHSRKKGDCGHWNQTTINRILGKETYIGNWIYCMRSRCKTENGLMSDSAKFISVSVPAIIDEETWQIARKRRKHNRRRGPHSYKYLLAKRFRCLHCNRLMTTKQFTNNPAPNDFRSYCGNAYGKEFACKNRAYYQHWKLELTIFEWAVKRFGVRAFKEFQDALRVRYLSQIDEGIAYIDLLIERKSKRLVRLSSLRELEYITAESNHERKRIIENTLYALEKERAWLRSRPGLIESSWPEEIDLADSYYIYPKDPNIDYYIRHAFIEHVDLRGVAALIRGQKIAHFTCKLGEITLSIPRRISERRGKIIRPVDPVSIGYSVSSAGALEKML